MAWNATGHMVIAKVALDELDPVARAECARLLQIGKTARAYDFLTAGPWADDTRTEANGPWHYINLHFREDGKKTFETAEPENVVTAIAKFSRVLKDRTKADAERADALRFLIHFVGDIHQPLHSVARDSDAFPAGDRGGNDFKIVPPKALESMNRPPSNLHSLWDLGCGLFVPIDRPLTTESEAKIGELANQLRKDHPRKRYVLADYEPTTWAVESLKDARRSVYRLKEGSQPTDGYLREGRKVSAKRAAVAGYRLADVLNHLIGANRQP